MEEEKSTEPASVDTVPDIAVDTADADAAEATTPEPKDEPTAAEPVEPAKGEPAEPEPADGDRKRNAVHRKTKKKMKKSDSYAELTPEELVHKEIEEWTLNDLMDTETAAERS